MQVFNLYWSLSTNSWDWSNHTWTTRTTVMELIEDSQVIDESTKVRECSRRIVELSKNRQELKECRLEASKLKKRIQGIDSKQKTTSLTNSSKKRYVIDEDAFYNQKGDLEDEEIQEKNGISSKKGNTKENEPNLARKLGLDEESVEQAKKDKNKKLSKEEIEKQKEIDEVRKIVEGGSRINKYIKEVDLLDLETPAKKDSPVKQTPKADKSRPGLRSR